MCFKLTVHLTSCKSGQRVILERNPLEFNFDIYHPLLTPLSCRHTADYEQGDCEQHGPCCELAELDVCDRNCQAGYIRCLGAIHFHLSMMPENRHKLWQYFVERPPPGEQHFPVLSEDDQAWYERSIQAYLETGMSLADICAAQEPRIARLRGIELRRWLMVYRFDFFKQYDDACKEFARASMVLYDCDGSPNIQRSDVVARYPTWYMLYRVDDDERAPPNSSGKTTPSSDSDGGDESISEHSGSIHNVHDGQRGGDDGDDADTIIYIKSSTTQNSPLPASQRRRSQPSSDGMLKLSDVTQSVEYPPAPPPGTWKGGWPCPPVPQRAVPGQGSGQIDIWVDEENQNEASPSRDQGTARSSGEQDAENIRPEQTSAPEVNINALDRLLNNVNRQVAEYRRQRGEHPRARAPLAEVDEMDREASLPRQHELGSPVMLGEWDEVRWNTPASRPPEPDISPRTARPTLPHLAQISNQYGLVGPSAPQTLPPLRDSENLREQIDGPADRSQAHHRNPHSPFPLGELGSRSTLPVWDEESQQMLGPQEFYEHRTQQQPPRPVEVLEAPRYRLPMPAAALPQPQAQYNQHYPPPVERTVYSGEWSVERARHHPAEMAPVGMYPFGPDGLPQDRADYTSPPAAYPVDRSRPGTGYHVRQQPRVGQSPSYAPPTLTDAALPPPIGQRSSPLDHTQHRAGYSMPQQPHAVNTWTDVRPETVNPMRQTLRERLEHPHNPIQYGTYQPAYPHARLQYPLEPDRVAAVDPANETLPPVEANIHRIEEEERTANASAALAQPSGIPSRGATARRPAGRRPPRGMVPSPPENQAPLEVSDGRYLFRARKQSVVPGAPTVTETSQKKRQRSAAPGPAAKRARVSKRMRPAQGNRGGRKQSLSATEAQVSASGSREALAAASSSQGAEAPGPSTRGGHPSAPNSRQESQAPAIRGGDSPAEESLPDYEDTE